MVVTKRIRRNTHHSGEMHDITKDIGSIVSESGVKQGIVTVCVVGSTAAIGTIEFEEGLMRDLPELLHRLIPPSRAYGHEQAWHDGNGHSHLQATLLGPSLTVPIDQSNLILGTWQQIFLIECDARQRQREVVVTVMGE